MPVGAASEVDAAKVTRRDAGGCSGVVQRRRRPVTIITPLTARIGERVHFWVLDAGSHRPTSHIVGGQFDTVYAGGVAAARAPRSSPMPRSAQVAPCPGSGRLRRTDGFEAGHCPIVQPPHGRCRARCLTRSWRSRLTRTCPPLQVRGIKLAITAGAGRPRFEADHHAMQGGDSNPRKTSGRSAMSTRMATFRLNELIHLTSPVPPR